MPINQHELKNLKNDLTTLVQNMPSFNSNAIEQLKVIELRRLNDNLEYLGSIMERAPWNIKE